ARPHVQGHRRVVIRALVHGMEGSHAPPDAGFARGAGDDLALEDGLETSRAPVATRTARCVAGSRLSRARSELRDESVRYEPHGRLHGYANTRSRKSFAPTMHAPPSGRLRHSLGQCASQ